jgi:hypothetical protein
MAYSIRNILTIFGPLNEADRFIGRFVRNGMEAFVPVSPTASPAHKYSETWGACPEYGDFEILTENSIVAGQLSDEGRPQIKSIDADWVSYNSFTLADHHKSILVLDLPGFAAQDKSPGALIVFHTKWRIPDRWIEAVINAEYERGIVLHMQSYDIAANAEMYMPEYGGECDHFHSFTSTGTEHIQSGHCAILIKVESGPLPTFDEMNNGVYDPALPLIDDEGNEYYTLIAQYLPPVWTEKWYGADSPYTYEPMELHILTADDVSTSEVDELRERELASFAHRLVWDRDLEDTLCACLEPALGDALRSASDSYGFRMGMKNLLFSAVNERLENGLLDRLKAKEHPLLFPATQSSAA